MKKTKHHIKIGDKVKVIAGNQKGFIGTISTLIKKKSVIILDGILPRIKFLKNNQSTEGKKKEIPIFIHSSNVMLWDVGNNLRNILTQSQHEGLIQTVRGSGYRLSTK